ANDSNVKPDMKKRSMVVGIFNKLKEWKQIIVVNNSNVYLDEQ
ncbi:4451_t:CDS:1, partial [Cetraspora pellucida]